MHGATNPERHIALHKIGVGPGGMKCPCCAPPKKDVKRLLRIAKRVAEVNALKFEEIADDLIYNRRDKMENNTDNCINCGESIRVDKRHVRCLIGKFDEPKDIFEASKFTCDEFVFCTFYNKGE